MYCSLAAVLIATEPPRVRACDDVADTMDRDFTHLELLDLDSCIMGELDYTTDTTVNDKALTFRKASVRSRQDDEKERTKDNQDEDNKGTDIKELVQQFWARTTAHGWGRVVKAPRHIVKLLWMTLTLLALTFSLIQIGLLVQKYLQYNTDVKWQMSMTEMEFPSVTICNIQPYSISTAESLLNNSSSKFYQWYNVTKNLNAFRGMAESINKSKEFEWVENRMKQPIGYFENIGDEAQLVGHQSMDFVIRCGFGFQQCNATNFTFYQSSVYFNCYTFNGGNVSRDTLISKTSGPQEGLSLILYLENDNGGEYVSEAMEWGTYHTLSPVGNAGGARIIVHSPDTRPSPADSGMDVPPGFSANVGLDVSRQQRQDYPWNRCVVPADWSTDRFVYSSHACLAICQQLYVMRHCQCVSSTLPVVSNTAFPDMLYCAFWNVTNLRTLIQYFDTLQCEAAKLLEFASNETLKSTCNCDPPCEEFSYKPDLSYSYWPLDFTQQDFYHTLIEENPNRDRLKAWQNLKHYNMTDLISTGLIRSNFARVNVYLKALTIEEYIEQRSYELANLFSDIGGSFGLWIGMSIITWGEVIELAVHIVYHGTKRLIWKYQQPKHVKPADREKY